MTLLCNFLHICGLPRACIQAKFPHCHQECWLIFSRWPTRPLGPLVLAPRQAVVLLPFPVDCLLLLTAFFCYSSSTLPRLFPFSEVISCARSLCRFRAKIDKGILWLAHTHTHKCLLSRHNWQQKEKISPRWKFREASSREMYCHYYYF